MDVPERCEMSKHSITSGGSGRSSCWRSFTFDSFFRNACPMFFSTSSSSFFFSPILQLQVTCTFLLSVPQGILTTPHQLRGGFDSAGGVEWRSIGREIPRRNPRGCQRSILLPESRPFSTENTVRKTVSSAMVWAITSWSVSFGRSTCWRSVRCSIAPIVGGEWLFHHPGKLSIPPSPIAGR